VTDPIVYTKGAATTGRPLTDEWETPRELVTLAAHAFGPFDLDAAASPANAVALRWLGAQSQKAEGGEPYFLDGLTHDWALAASETAWMNPPYSRAAGPLKLWIERAIYYGSMDGRRVVALLKSDTSTKWFKRAFDAAQHVIFLSPRVIHTRGGKPQGTPPWGSVLFVFENRGSRKQRQVRIARWL